MIIVLLTIFAIAIIIILAGLRLTPRTPLTPLTLEREIPYHDRVRGSRARSTGEDRQVYGSRYRNQYIGEGRRMYARRAPVEIQRRAWSGILGSLNVGRLFRRRPGVDTPWLGIILILCVLFLLGSYLIHAGIPNSSSFISTTWVGTTNFNNYSSAGSAGSSQPPFSGQIGASKTLKRINQLDPAQYASTQEYNLWAYSTCSTASMTEVINAYGHKYRITDILKVEAGLKEITPALGLLDPNGIDRTVAQFNFQTTWLYKPSLTTVINVANQGRPVIVNFPPSRWDGGHLLVVTGGTKDSVYLADSSSYNMQVMAQKNFLKYWIGFAVVVTPK